MEDDKKNNDGSKKKLVIRRVTVSALKVQSGLRTGSCDNACTSPTPVPKIPDIQCPAGRARPM